MLITPKIRELSTFFAVNAPRTYIYDIAIRQ